MKINEFNTEDFDLNIDIKTYEDGTLDLVTQYEHGTDIIPVMTFDRNDGDINDCIQFVEEMISTYKETLKCLKCVK